MLDNIESTAQIFCAWHDEPWVVDGASVRVSLICFAPTNFADHIRLDGRDVSHIYSDLRESTETKANLTKSFVLVENAGFAFQGIKRVGKFEIPRDQAIEWISHPLNPNGKNNSDVLRPWISGFDIVRRPQDYWIVDFGWDTSYEDASLFEAPFDYLDREVRPSRKGKRESRANEMWWIFYWPRPELCRALKRISRYAARPSVAKHHIFRWMHSAVIPDGSLVVIALDSDVMFGILQSRPHELWSLAQGSTLEDRPAYTPTTTFETFPFPEGLTPNIPAADYADDPRAIAIAKAAARLNELRENWLNPADLVRREPEVVPGYPDRILPVSLEAEKELKKRTLTNLYNARPTWLVNTHKALDEAIAAAYGWPADLSDDEVLARLFALNQERAATQAKKS